jgi:flagellar hook-associated protein 2
MAGVQISGLLSNSAFDWKSVVDQLIAIDTVPITRLTQQQEINQQKMAALETVKTAMLELQDAVQAMRADNVFAARTVSSDVTGTTWKSTSVTGAAVGSYKFAVQQLASAARLEGGSGIARGLAASSDVSGVTLATLRTATALTAGTFTVDGHSISVGLTDSLQDVFDRIATQTGDVTAVYDSSSDAIRLTRSSGELVLGAANDSSNFLAVARLANNGLATAASSGPLGTVQLTTRLIDAGLAGPLIPTEGGTIGAAGDGTFLVNGVPIGYNINDDSLGGLINRINAAGAGVTASYDAVHDRLMLANKVTGDMGVTLSEPAGGILSALKLTTATGGSFVHGTNAQFRVNNGPLQSSASNTLDATAHGIAGLSVTVNSETTQTLQVESDTATMNGAIQSFVDKFNAVQDVIEANTKVTVTGNTVSAAILASNREIQEWARRLQRTAFESVAGATGSVSRLDNLGIDFNSTSGKLVVKNSGKLAGALSERPDDVESFFMNGSSGFVSKMYGFMSGLLEADRTQQSALGATNTNLDAQIATLQTRLAAERELLTNSFLHMLDAQSTAQSQTTYLTNTFFKNNASN